MENNESFTEKDKIKEAIQERRVTPKLDITIKNVTGEIKQMIEKSECKS